MTTYANAVKEAMELDEDDFDEDDYQFGFTVPKKCDYKNDCRWICDNMVDAFGVAMGAITSSQNYDIADVKKFKDNFLTPIIQTSTDPLPPAEDEPRQLSNPLKADTPSVEYVQTGGYTADDDQYETGLVIDDPKMHEDIKIDDDEEASASHKLWYVIGGAVVVFVLLTVALMCRAKGDMGDYRASEL